MVNFLIGETAGGGMKRNLAKVEVAGSKPVSRSTLSSADIA